MKAMSAEKMQRTSSRSTRRSCVGYSPSSSPSGPTGHSAGSSPRGLLEFHVNAIFRLGDELSLRLARRKVPTEPGGKELEWLPRLAPLLPLDIPVPVAQGRPTGEYPWFWDV